MTTHKKILIIAYPGQGLINPALRFATRLLKFGVDVTFCTSLSVIQRMNKDTAPLGLTFASFSDCHDNGMQKNSTLLQFLTDIETNGVCALEEIITSAAAAGKPFDHLLYTTVLPWAARVAKNHSLRASLLWCQPATILDIYYYYFNGYQSLISSDDNDPLFSINLPGLPLLKYTDLPSVLAPSCPKEHEFLIPILKDHFDVLTISSRIPVNTFSELEIESIRAVEKLDFLLIGPLIPEASTGRDLFEKGEEDSCIQWLNIKSVSSVLYVSFGTLASFSMDQLEEIAIGLLECGRSFLWVIRDNEQSRKLSKIAELNKQGMIVDWCSQVEVLNHKSIGCFVMHCGWNSTLEALAAGVPLVVFPQWSDQGTNAKMVEDVWKTGIRLRKREEDGVVEGKEIKRCVKMVMGNEEMRRNVEKWKELAVEAVSDGGSSHRNLQSFIENA